MVNIQDFKVQCNSRISPDPLSRLSNPLKSVIHSSDYSIDCHCHLMNKQNLVGNYLVMRALGKIDPRESLWDDAVDYIMDCTVDNKMDQVVDILNARNMAQVADHYLKNFSISEKMILSVLMMDIEYGLPFKAPKQSMTDQVSELNNLSRNFPLLPFLALDPRRVQESGADNLYSLFLQAFAEDGGFFTGVKIYPSMGYLPSHPVLMDIFEICQAKQIPVTAHCGGPTVRSRKWFIPLTGTAFVKEWKLFPGGSEFLHWKNRRIGRRSIKKAEFLNSPMHWKPVLEAFPDLSLNLGHLGGNEQWLDAYESGQDQRIRQIMDLMEQFPRVYGDFSGIPLDRSLLTFFLDEPDYEILRQRALYGSDYWVNLLSGQLGNTLDRCKNLSQDLRKRFEQDNPKAFLWQI